MKLNIHQQHVVALAVDCLLKDGAASKKLSNVEYGTLVALSDEFDEMAVW